MNTVYEHANDSVKNKGRLLSALLVLSFLAGAASAAELSDEIGASPKLAAPSMKHPAVNFSTVVGWPGGQAPQVPEGFVVERFAQGLISPRWAYVLPNGDVLVAESTTVPDRDTSHIKAMRQAGSLGTNANRITLLRDTDGDGKPDVRRVFLDDLNQPFGMV